MLNTVLEQEASKNLMIEDKEIHPLDCLNQLVENHPFWQNRLFIACMEGELNRDDFTYIFSQYYLYSKNFTRYIAGVMANCDQDNFRAQLTQNLWEESGEESGLTHAEIFRTFLKDSLDVKDLSGIEYESFTRDFLDIYLKNSMQADPIWGSAWLSLGTEGIVSKMYKIMVKGMHQAGFVNTELEFFHIHIDCDDDHAETLAKLMCSYADRSEWYQTCAEATDRALTARMDFFNCLYDRIEPAMNRSLTGIIQNRKSLAKQIPNIDQLKVCTTNSGTKLYNNIVPHLNIEFIVERLLFPAVQVLDPRIVCIPAGKNNEKHRHAHEALFYIIKGSGLVTIDDRSIEVVAGNMVFIPRWCVHQSKNTGDEEMQILAITDFGLTSKVLGDYERQTRMK